MDSDLQLLPFIYTSSRALRGFRPFNYHKSLSEQDIDDLIKIVHYRRSDEDSYPSNPTAEQLKNYPVRICFRQLRSGRYAFSRSVYIGRDRHSRSPRMGNYMGQALVIEESAYQKLSYLPLIQVYDNEFWQDELLTDDDNQGNAGPKSETVSLSNLNALEVFRELFNSTEDDSRLNKFGQLIETIINDKGAERGKLKIKIKDRGHLLHLWLQALFTILPFYKFQSLSFNSYPVEDEDQDYFILGEVLKDEKRKTSIEVTYLDKNEIEDILESAEIENPFAKHVVNYIYNFCAYTDPDEKLLQLIKETHQYLEEKSFSHLPEIIKVPQDEEKVRRGEFRNEIELDELYKRYENNPQALERFEDIAEGFSSSYHIYSYLVRRRVEKRDYDQEYVSTALKVHYQEQPSSRDDLFQIILKTLRSKELRGLLDSRSNLQGKEVLQIVSKILADYQQEQRFLKSRNEVAEVLKLLENKGNITGKEEFLKSLEPAYSFLNEVGELDTAFGMNDLGLIGMGVTQYLEAALKLKPEKLQKEALEIIKEHLSAYSPPAEAFLDEQEEKNLGELLGKIYPKQKDVLPSRIWKKLNFNYDAYETAKAFQKKDFSEPVISRFWENYRVIIERYFDGVSQPKEVLQKLIQATESSQTTKVKWFELPSLFKEQDELWKTILDTWLTRFDLAKPYQRLWETLQYLDHRYETGFIRYFVARFNEQDYSPESDFKDFDSLLELTQKHKADIKTPVLEYRKSLRKLAFVDRDQRFVRGYEALKKKQESNSEIDGVDIFDLAIKTLVPPCDHSDWGALIDICQELKLDDKLVLSSLINVLKSRDKRNQDNQNPNWLYSSLILAILLKRDKGKEDHAIRLIEKHNGWGIPDNFGQKEINYMEFVLNNMPLGDGGKAGTSSPLFQKIRKIALDPPLRRGRGFFKS